MDLTKGKNNDNISDELLQSQAHVWNNIFSFVNSMSLKCAIQLGIPDIIHNHAKPMTLNQLLTTLQIHPTKTQCVYHLMRILVHSGFFALQKTSENEQEEGYILTSASKLLLKDHPLSLAPFLLAMLDPILTKPWHQVSTWIQNDDDDDAATTFALPHGMNFWDYAVRETRLNHFFNEGMASDTRLTSSALINKCKDVFEGLNTLVDVGGGTGTLASAIAKKFPHIECTVFDQPHVVADLKSNGNLKYVGGNMFEAIPLADAVLIKCVLHNWNDEECVKILENCKKAIAINGKAGKVIIIDIKMESEKADYKTTETQLFMDMLMMVLVKGEERNEKEWAKLFFEAGFSDYKITDVLGVRSLIEVYP